MAIPSSVKKKVEERDGHACVFCGRSGKGEAHFISRAHGGLGIEENLLTVCRACHEKLDNSTERKKMLWIAEAYLKDCYPYWSKDLLIYEKRLSTKDRLAQVREKYEKQRLREHEVLEKSKKTKPPEGFFFID